MNDDLARRAHGVLMQAIELRGAERAAFLSAACAGDALLRGRIDALAAALTRSGTFLEVPVLQTGEQNGPAPELAHPTEISGYKIVRVLGVGGMATVYEAMQQHPPRRVALKVMRLGLTHSSALQRFQFETEVLARLQHPGIAQIYEAGTYDDGQGRMLPFFAMEYIEGAQTITGFATSRGLATRERLELFLGACDAVQYGHQLGVIHRDLKPGNLLVDGAGRPKVIDFGVARRSNPDDTRITVDADGARLIGTLHYMSPEQCSATGVIDVRTDVYSLGVVLYELIAGRVPLDLSRTSLIEAIRIITRDSPPPLGALMPEARGDLSAIVGMALEKEPQRRYASVGALAADVRRHLNHQPIDARPATTLYQLRKFARRNRGVVIATAAVFCSLVAGIASTTRMAIVAQRAQSSAEARERELTQVTAFQEAQLSQIDVSAMGRRLRGSLAEALNPPDARPDVAQSRSADFERLFAEVNFTTLASRALDETILQRSYDAIQTQFTSQPQIQATLLQRLAMTSYALGLPARAAAIADEALGLRRARLGPDHVDALQSLHLRAMALNAGGRYDEAIGLFRELLERSTRILGPEDEKTLLTAGSLGGALRLAGDLDGAERVWRETLQTQQRVFGDDHPATIRTLNNIGIIHALRGQTADAEAIWREVLERRRRTLGPDHPELRGSLGNLGLTLQDQGKLDEARGLLEEDLAVARRSLGDDHPSALDSMLNLSSLLLELGEIVAAEHLRRECFEGRRRALGADHPATWRAMGALADVYRESDCPLEADELLRVALAGQTRRLGPGHPDTIESLTNLSAVCRLRGEFHEAEALGNEAVTRARRTHAPQHPALADCLLQQGRALSELQLWDEAEAALQEAYGILLAAYPENHAKGRAAVEALSNLYELLAAAKRT